MKNKIFKLINICVISSFLAACGGGGGSSSETTTPSETTSTTPSEETSVEISYPITPLGTAIDYSKFAWSINGTSLDSSFKTTNTIDDNAHIHMPSSTNNQKIKVAIIDQGFQYNHPDLAEKVIDVKYISNTILENEYHGTAIAGIIASTYLGVAPNNVELILINIDFDSITESELIEAFNYAKDAGAKIINCSWGSTRDETNTYPFSQTFTNTIANLKIAGISVIFASGNGDDSENALDLDNSLNDLSELDSAIGVGATSVLNDVTSYSNYGSNIDIIAPGGGGYYNNVDLIGMISLDLVGDAGISNSSDIDKGANYAFWKGTSFSVPTISGVIALMLSENPNLTAENIRSILIETADKVSNDSSAQYIDLASDNTTSTFNTQRAYGKVNASAAIQAAINAL